MLDKGLDDLGRPRHIAELALRVLGSEERRAEDDAEVLGRHLVLVARVVDAVQMTHEGLERPEMDRRELVGEALERVDLG